MVVFRPIILQENNSINVSEEKRDPVAFQRGMVNGERNEYRLKI